MREIRTKEQREELIEKVIGLVELTTTPLACKQVGVAVSTFRNWIDTGSSELIARYTRARSMYVDKLVGEALELADEPLPMDDRGRTDSGLVQQRRTQIDLRKWLASKMAPKKYGDRLTVAGDDVNPVVIHTIERKVIDTTAEEVEQEETDDD